MNGLHTGISFVDNFGNWAFLNEPLYRWFLFSLAMGAIMWGWHGILDFMH